MTATFDRLTKRWRAEASKRGFTVAETAAALGLAPHETWELIWRGELRTIEIAGIVVVAPEELVRLGVL